MNRIYGIDLLRGTACIFVVAWHVGIVQSFGHPGSGFEFSISDFLGYNVLLLAVPTFFLISLFLLFHNIEGKILSLYSTRRLLLVSRLFIFWLIIQTIIVQLVSPENNFFNNESLILDHRHIISFISNGGGALPLVGASVFYFLFYLLCLTVVAFLSVSLFKKTYKYRTPIFLVSLIYVVSIPYLVMSYDKVPWNSLAFLIYTFIAWNIAVDYKCFIHGEEPIWRMKTKCAILAAGWLITSLTENFWGYYYFSELGSYSRVSLYFGSASLMYLFVTFRLSSSDPSRIENTMGKVISVFGAYSLGIFCVHKYILLVLLRTVDSSWLSPNSMELLLVVLLLSLALVLAMSKIKGIRSFFV